MTFRTSNAATLKKMSRQTLCILITACLMTGCLSRAEKMERSWIHMHYIGKRIFENPVYSSEISHQLKLSYTYFSEIKGKNALLLQGMACDHCSISNFFILSEHQYEKIQMPLDSLKLSAKLMALKFKNPDKIIAKMSQIYAADLSRKYDY